ncbi:hypothetical protein [Jannaschia sp. 2305UL9-9]|uniref:hypothetical protein n=1 Tax=Jannaschia sp. 2305UL9-9 TaxID=3121638 RepID=UPI0035293568
MSAFKDIGFLTAEDGAVTVDWVVLTAAMVGLGLSVMGVVSTGVESQSEDISDYMTDSNLVKTYFGLRTVNGSFEDVFGLAATSWGHRGASTEGWTSLNGQQFEVVESGHGGVIAYDGDYFLDMDASPGNNSIVQTLEDTRPGEEYTLSFAALDRQGSNSVEVYWGGELVDTINAGRDWGTYEYTVRGDAGDGSNTIELRETGTSNNVGTYVDAISFGAD